MNPHGKDQNVSHCFYSPSFGATRRCGNSPVEGTTSHSATQVANQKSHQPWRSGAPSQRANRSVFRSGTRLTSQCVATQPLRDVRAGSALHSASATGIRSRVVCGVGVCSWAANQQQDGGAGQNVLGKKTSLSQCSAAASSSRRAASSLVIGSQNRSISKAASARRAMPTSLSRDDRSQTRKLCMRSTALCSPMECRSESNQRQSRNGWGYQRPRKTIYRRNGLRVGEPTRIGRLSWPALGRTSNVSERGVTGRRDGHPIQSSGDGLGIQQPGSMTRGTRAKVKTPSGRARDRATCPAVARFIQRRAA